MKSVRPAIPAIFFLVIWIIALLIGNGVLALVASSFFWVCWTVYVIWWNVQYWRKNRV